MISCRSEAKLIHKLHRTQSFTLIELLAVMLVIGLLVGIMIGMAGYVQKRTGMMTTKAQIAVMVAALESYKGDFGYYPPTTPIHFSNLGGAESTNNAILYRALCGQGKRYLAKFPGSQIRVNASTGLTNIFDVFGTLFNYYNSPTTPSALFSNNYVYPTGPIDSLTGYATGGQVNPLSYDLLSCGPDCVTFVATNCQLGSWNDGPWMNPGVKTKTSTLDDITSWGR